jgi:acyl-CoA thioesterase-1
MQAGTDGASYSMVLRSRILDAMEGDRPGASGLRYVALGDSYTIGTAVPPADRWPDQLVRTMGSEPPTLELVANLGVNGYTSRDLIRDELPPLRALEPGFASVLIGVNDVVQGVPTGTDRLVTVAIPDYTVTPAGGDYGDPGRQHDGIVACNTTMARLARDRGIAYVDTFEISLGAVADRSLVADDGLHPSGRQYAAWVERIRPVVDALLGRAAVTDGGA